MRAYLLPLPLVLGLLGCSSELYHGLPEDRANQALVALREAGFQADKKVAERGGGGRPGNFTLVVPRDEEVRALRFLMERGLPRLPAPPPESAGGGLFALPEERHAQHSQLLSESLRASLESLPQVLSARVHLALPPPDPLHPAEAGRPSASVLLRLREPGLRPGDVERLVARAVPGLDEKDVSVLRVAEPGPGMTSAGPDLVPVGPLRVARESQGLAGALLALLFIVSAALLGSAGWYFRRRS